MSIVDGASDAATRESRRMRLVLAFAAVAACAAPANATCFRDCLGSRIAATSDDIAIKDAARTCREVCEAEVRDGMEKNGTLAQLKSCRGEELSLADLRKLRGETASYYVQSNVFIWDFKNPFPDRAITKIEVSAQNMDLNDVSFTGTGLVPPAGEGVFVIPAFFDGYPAVRFAAKVRKVWACPVK
jgi:hypothetical protein